MVLSSAAECFFTRGDSALNGISIKWSYLGSKPMINRILLTSPQNRNCPFPGHGSPVPVEKSCPEVATLLGQLIEFIDGADIRFSLDLLRLDRCSDFQRKVLITEFSIPRGRVSSYSLLARHLDLPGGSRAVGTALSTNPFPLVIPCHRVVRSDGSLGGYQGGLAMKRTLLEKEGLLFDKRGKVITSRFHDFRKC